MNNLDEIIVKKFSQIEAATINEESAKNLLGKLTKEEYERLIELFTAKEIPGIGLETKEKLIMILKRLREKFNQR